MQGATFNANFSSSDTPVSIHAPYAGSDLTSVLLTLALFQGFNPRPLCRERREERLEMQTQHAVSIHAPYAGSDGSLI